MIQDTETTTAIHALNLGTEPCATCGALMAPEQRYCLNCGNRREQAPEPLLALLAGQYAPPAGFGGPAGTPPPPTGAPVAGPSAPGGGKVPGPRVSPRTAMIAGGLGVAFGWGILIGVLAKPDTTPAVAAQKAPVINIQAGPTGGTAPVAAATPTPTPVPVAFVSDWPGNDGYTIQLQTLPKASTPDPTAVATAKTDATTKGATAVGALDSDTYPSLDPGNYVVYSGTYTTRKEAKAALPALTSSFPDAKIVKVSSTASSSASDTSDSSSDSSSDTSTKVDKKAPKVDKSAKKVTNEDLQKEQNLTGKAQQDAVKKAPDKVAKDGAPPAKDNKAPGGDDSGAAEIG